MTGYPALASIMHCSILRRNTNGEPGGIGMHVCGVECVCERETLGVCDRLEKEDKWSVATGANDFIHQTALWVFRRRERGG